MVKVFINGYGWTGSSAVSEALRKYSNVNFVPNEFDDLRVPYGAYDLYQQKLEKIKIILLFHLVLAEFDISSGMPKHRIKVLKLHCLLYLELFAYISQQ